jgi:hypothetical protein
MDVYNKHLEVFGVKPVVIGMYWDDIEKLEALIEESIEKNIPYNEENKLTKEELRDFYNGNLSF